MWVYDGEKWLQMPGGGGGTVTTSAVLLDQPTARMPSGATTQADANAYFATALQEVVDEDGNPLVDLSDYYTSTEADEKFQPKGDYIADAPSDGNLYIRKDGGWEVYVPSSGGGGSYMKPVKQPATVGEWTYSMRGNVGSRQFKEGTWNVSKNAEKVRLTVPAGFKFVLTNLTTINVPIKLDKLKIDGVQIWETGSQMGNEYTSTTYDKWFWDDPQSFVAEDYVEFGGNGTYDTWWHLMGWFIAADGTRESEVLREEYLAAEAERIAAMPPPEPEEVGTQEIPDE